jgi:hypothetical protein
MIEPVYKAVVHTKLDPTILGLLKQWATYAIAPRVYTMNGQQVVPLPNTTLQGYKMPSFVDRIIDDGAAYMRRKALDDAKEQLAERADDLLNVYVDCDRTTYDVTITYVFGNKDTALMFKLAQ